MATDASILHTSITRFAADESDPYINKIAPNTYAIRIAVLNLDIMRFSITRMIMEDNPVNYFQLANQYRLIINVWKEPSLKNISILKWLKTVIDQWWWQMAVYESVD